MAYAPSCMHRALLQALSILLFASMLVPGSAEEAPSGYRIELIHVDANGGFTGEEFIQRIATDGTNSPASSGTYSVAAVHSHNAYLMKLEIGTPPEPFMGVADTGSDLVWTKQLKLCNCSASSTFTHMNCSDSCPDGCKSCPGSVMCDTCYDGLCMFKKLYGRRQKTARGFMGNETLTLSGKATDKNVSFGCAIHYDDDLLKKSADGIVGLNRGPRSLVQQLNVTKFSYCLSNQLQPELSSRLWFGNGADLGPSAGGESRYSLQTTPLVQISIEQCTPVLANRYYVELEDISIGGNRLGLQKGHFKLKSTNGKGVMFVDTGCPRTFLERDVFSLLKEKLAAELSDEKFTKEKKESTCFRPPAAPSKADMVLHFTNGTEMHIPWANYTDEREVGLFCLAIHESGGNYSVLGNFQQQNTYMLYDLTEGDGKLSFKQDVNCSTL